VGLVVLIAALVVGVKLIFWGLERALPTPAGTAQSAVETVDASQNAAPDGQAAPNFCPNCGEKLPETFQWGQFCPYCGEKVAWESGEH
jgi:membrane protease subunit (stomatin/prohibitin family)